MIDFFGRAGCHGMLAWFLTDSLPFFYVAAFFVALTAGNLRLLIARN